MEMGPALRVDPRAHRGRAQPAEQGSYPERQLLGRERLGQIVVGAQRQPADPVGLFPPGGEENDADILGFLPPSKLCQHVIARDTGQHQIEDHHVGPFLPRRLQGVGPVGGGGHPIAHLGQVVGDQRGDVRLVVHDEDTMGHAQSRTRG